MSSIYSFSLAFVALASLVQGGIIPSAKRGGHTDTGRPDLRTHGPDSRDCWLDGYDIDTNPHEQWPTTGRTRTFDLRITNQTCNPDGHGPKYCQLVNGQYPGPVIRADWGDTLRIVVHNDLENNGTSIHWHGMRQLNSNEQDGTNGLTECPIAPGSTKTYEFKATQYGTSWYHSHHSSQYGEGVLGPIIIDGPATAHYDEDLGVLPLTDWFYDQTWMLLWRALFGAGPPPDPDTVLINGTMVDGNGHGQYQKLNVEKGKRYRLRFVNTAVDHFFHVSLDGHPFTVIQADFVAVTPYTTTDLKIYIGQRYDVVFTADQDISNYWLRVQPGGPTCGGARIYTNPNVTVGAILSYDGAPDKHPTSTGSPLAKTCDDEVFTPHIPIPVPSEMFQQQLRPLDVDVGTGSQNIVNWFINGSSMIVDWEEPTLSFIRKGEMYSRNMNVVELSKPDMWYFWVIRNSLAVPIPHPVHLHGHDFWLLGSGTGPFPNSTSVFNFKNAVRRDVATLPGDPTGGWLLLAFPADNPGAWLMHCHIAWHAAEGLSMQFVERRDDIMSTIGSLEEYDRNCAEWQRYRDIPGRERENGASGLFIPGKTKLEGPGADPASGL